MLSYRVEPMQYGPVRAQPFDSEASGNGGEPNFHQWRPATHHQHTGIHRLTAL